MKTFTSNTITNFKDFVAELERVRADGYALDLEEFEDGLRCIAAPVRDQTDRVIAALGIAGPRQRLDTAEMKRRVPVVVAAAESLSRSLGYVERHAPRLRTAS
jgi:DNA-binding IclR family transcriptional regulator